MRARALGVRDVMKFMGVVNFLQALLNVKRPTCCSFSYKHMPLTTRFYGMQCTSFVYVGLASLTQK